MTQISFTSPANVHHSNIEQQLELLILQAATHITCVHMDKSGYSKDDIQAFLSNTIDTLRGKFQERLDNKS